MAEKTGITQQLLKYLERQVKNQEMLLNHTDLVGQETRQQTKVIDLYTSRIEEMTNTLQDLPVLAQAISSKLGEEEAFTRELSHQVAVMFENDRDLAEAYKMADDESKKMMFKMIQDDAKDKLNLTGQMLFDYHDAIENAMVNVEGNMDVLITRSESLLFPLITNMTRAIDDWRHEIVADRKILGRFFSDEMMEHYRTGIMEIGGHFKQHMTTILAPVQALVGPFVAVAKSLFTVGKTLFSGPTKYEKETAKVQREIRDTLKKSQSTEEKSLKQRAKEKAREFFSKEGGTFEKMKKFFTKGLLMVVAVVGLAMGALVAKILLPFQVIMSMFSGIGAVAKLIPTFTKIFDWMMDIFKIAQVFLEALPVLGKHFANFFQAFSFGFKYLGWPLQIILSLIDFIKGFMNTEGNIIQKIMGGLEQVFIGFFELPIRIFSWLYEKLLGVFGVEAKGTADKIIGGIRWLFGAISDTVNTLFMPIRLAFSYIGAVMGFIGDTISGIFGAFKQIFSGDIIGGLKTLLLEFNPIALIGKFVKTIFDMFVDFFSLGSLVRGVKDWVIAEYPMVAGLLGLGPSQEDADDKKAEYREASRKYSNVRGAYAVGESEDSLMTATHMSTSRSYQGNINASEASIRNRGGRVYDDKERGELEGRLETVRDRKKAEYEEMIKMIESTDVVGAVTKYYKAIWETIGKFFDKIKEIATMIVDGLIDAIPKIVDGLWSAFEGFWNGLGDVIGKVFDGLSTLIPTWDDLFKIVSGIVPDFAKSWFGIEKEHEQKPIPIVVSVSTPQTPLESRGFRKSYDEIEYDRMMDKQKQLSDAGMKSGKFIAGDLVIPGQEFNDNQKDWLRMGKEQGIPLPTGITDKDVAISDSFLKMQKELQEQADKHQLEWQKLFGDKEKSQASASANVSASKGDQKEVPDDIESMAILFNNKSWGMG